MDDCGTPVFIYLRYFLTEYKKRDPEFSLRALARKSGVSVSALSKAINAKSKLSPVHAYQFASTIGLQRLEYNAFIDRVFYEFSSDYNLSIQPEDAPDWSSEIIKKIDQIRKLKSSSTIEKTLVYQLRNDNIQWILQSLQDRDSRKKSENFNLSLLNIDNGSVSTTYFIKNIIGSYQALSQDSFHRSGPVKPNGKHNLNVKFTEDGFPEVYSFPLQTEEKMEPEFIDLIFTRSKCFHKKVLAGSCENQSTELHKVYFRV